MKWLLALTFLAGTAYSQQYGVWPPPSGGGGSSPWVASGGAVTLVSTGQFYNKTFTASGNIDWNNGNTQLVQLTTGQTYAPTFSNPQDGAKYTLLLAQPVTGMPATITLPTAVHFNASPVFSASVNLTDIVTLVYSATSGHYYADYSTGYAP